MFTKWQLPGAMLSLLHDKVITGSSDSWHGPRNIRHALDQLICFSIVFALVTAPSLGIACLTAPGGHKAGKVIQSAKNCTKCLNLTGLYGKEAWRKIQDSEIWGDFKQDLKPIPTPTVPSFPRNEKVRARHGETQEDGVPRTDAKGRVWLGDRWWEPPQGKPQRIDPAWLPDPPLPFTGVYHPQLGHIVNDERTGKWVRFWDLSTWDRIRRGGPHCRTEEELEPIRRQWNRWMAGCEHCQWKRKGES